MDDYAIVVGISRYPGLNQPGYSFDLLGPDRDAEDIRDWLLSPEGGGLKPSNVTVIKSSDFDPAGDPWDAKPEYGSIKRAFLKLRDKGYDADKNLKLPMGRRLYLYLSGHGFSQSTNQPALLTAEAIPDLLTNLYAQAWIEWFRTAGFFREYALWVDCCMNGFTQVQAEQLPNKLVGGDPGLAFVGVAANSRSALECEMPDGKIHGVFTWTLLEGLRGKAAENGVITGESLRRFVYNAMADYLPKEVREASTVDVKPAVQTDLGIVFRTGVPDPKQTITLKGAGVPDGTAVRIWGGQPHAEVASGVFEGESWRGDLDRGLYLAEIPTAGCRHGFEVTGSGDVELWVSAQGPPVVPPGAQASYSLSVSADNQAAAITVVNHQFEKVLSGTGALMAGEPPGLYKIRAQLSSDISSVVERVILLDRNDSQRISAPVMPAPPMPVPSSTPERPVSAFESFTAAPISTGISILARYWTTDAIRQQPGVRFPNPFEGLELHDAKGARVAGLLELADTSRIAEPDPVLVVTGALEPGPYFLRQTLLDGRILEATVIVAPGWITQCVIRRSPSDVRTGPDEPHVGALGDLAVLMRRPGVARMDYDATLETACVALAEQRPVFQEGRGAMLLELLTSKYENPVAGIVGGHLWLLSQTAAPGTTPHLHNDVVRNLRALVGDSHPDVEILSLYAEDESLWTKQPLIWPPMFRRSWELLVQAAYANPEIVSKELWDRVHAVSAERLHFVWAADERTRAAHRLQLRLLAATEVPKIAAEAAAAAAADALLMPQAAFDSAPAGGLESTLPRGLEGAVRRRSKPKSLSKSATQAALRSRARDWNIVPAAMKDLWKDAPSAGKLPSANPRHFCVCKETAPTTGRTKAALLNMYRWPAGSTITVRFMDGDPALCERVKKVAVEWAGPGMAHLVFNFVDAGDADVRVAFIQGNGSWSYLGTMCREVPKTDPTMNYGWLTPESTDDELRRVVLHEFGHALGLVHEHQNPQKPIQWNRDAVKKDLSGPPNNWDDATIERNIYSKYDPDELVGTPVDATSIMMYPIPQAWTLDGFSAGLNKELSDIDRDFIRVTYSW